MGYFRILAAIPGFLVSSLILMVLWRVIAPKLGVPDIGYVMAMLITITMWLTVAPRPPLAAVTIVGEPGPGHFALEPRLTLTMR